MTRKQFPVLLFSHWSKMEVCRWFPNIRLLSRVEEDSSSEIEVNQLLQIYRFEMTEAGISPTTEKRAFFEYIKIVFPHVIRDRRKSSHETKTVYRGIKIKLPHLQEETKFSSITELKHILHKDFVICEENSKSVTCSATTEVIINEVPLCKTVKFLENKSWLLIVNGKEIDLSKVHVSNTYIFSKESIELVCETVLKLKLCTGVQITKSVIITRFHIVERLKIGSKLLRVVRSMLCDRVVTMNSITEVCRKCQKLTLKIPQSNKENKNPDPNNDKVETLTKTQTTSKKKLTIEDLKMLIPDITDEIAELVLSQAENISRDPRGRRWSQKMISVCLQWYCRSPLAYESFRATKMLIMPCPSTLVLYKNTIKHETGFDDKILNWMHSEAVQKEIHPDGWIGGIIIDEMAIQSDLQISKNGDVVEICGLSDLGEEANSSAIIRTGKNERSIGTYALQFVFLGLTGFRFPFAHFITNGIQGTELYQLFWEAVDRLQMFGFRIVYTSTDGAQSNRNFIKYNLCDNNCIDKPFQTSIPCNFGELVFIMDISHVIKKVRNNIYSSGTEGKSKHHTRLLTLPSTHTIQWQMLCDCFHWDKQNCLQLHKKLTSEHINLTPQSKMRNHLAEDILNSEMLNTMIQFQASLGEKGNILYGVIEVLQQTSKLIDIYRDMRPIIHMDDPRIAELLEISTWFKTWRDFTETNKSSRKGKQQQFLSYQCYDDIQSCILGFVGLCRIVTKISKEIYITPGLINSDIVENLFNQQRSTYHGANSNPNALQYKRALNSIIVGQNIVSRKANAGKGRDAAMPFNISVKNYPSKRQKLSGKC